MAGATCPHGFAPGTCLICQTLGMGSSAPATTKARPKAPTKPVDSPGVHVLPAPRRRLTIGTRLLGAALVLVAVLVAVWWVTLLAAAVLRFVELGAVTVVAGYVGWRLGVHHGRRISR